MATFLSRFSSVCEQTIRLRYFQACLIFLAKNRIVWTPLQWEMVNESPGQKSNLFQCEADPWTQFIVYLFVWQGEHSNITSVKILFGTLFDSYQHTIKIAMLLLTKHCLRLPIQYFFPVFSYLSFFLYNTMMITRCVSTRISPGERSHSVFAPHLQSMA